MPIDFPTSPTTGDVYTYLGNSWVYNGTGWDVPKAGSLNLENLVPPGTVTQFAGVTAPTGYLLCQGQSLDTTTYGNLFNVIEYTYGGSGSSFLLPNLQNRVPVGKGPDAEFDALGETGGAKTHTLTIAEMPSHTHTQNPHTHGLRGPVWRETGFNVQMPTGSGTGVSVDQGLGTYEATATNQSTGGSAAHNNLQPYIVLNYIIKT